MGIALSYNPIMDLGETLLAKKLGRYMNPYSGYNLPMDSEMNMDIFNFFDNVKEQMIRPCLNIMYMYLFLN